MNLGIVGSRNFKNYLIIDLYISKIRSEYKIDKIISGGANGADRLAKDYANLNNLEIIEHLAEWEKFGKSAGFKRNELIWKDSDIIIAFWDGVSKGTKHTIDNYKGLLLVVEYTKQYDTW